MKASIDRDSLLQAIEGFTARHRHALHALVRRNSQLLEVAALMSCVQHYEHSGYVVSAMNTDPAGTVVFKSATTGDPRKYSWFAVATDSGQCFEIHANLPVKSAYGLDGGVYVVDVAVVTADAAATKVRGRQWVVESLSVLTFAEVKALPVYPMLLAHFVGIVHEVKPQFLAGRVPYGFRRDRHLSLDPWTGR